MNVGTFTLISSEKYPELFFCAFVIYRRPPHNSWEGRECFKNTDQISTITSLIVFSLDDKPGSCTTKTPRPTDEGSMELGREVSCWTGSPPTACLCLASVG